MPTIEIITCAREINPPPNTSIIGLAQGVAVEHLPAEIEQMELFLRIHFEPEECGDHLLSVLVLDPESQEVLRTTERIINVKPEPLDGHGYFMSTMGLSAVPLAREGLYFVTPILDGRGLYDLRFYVRLQN